MAHFFRYGFSVIGVCLVVQGFSLGVCVADDGEISVETSKLATEDAPTVSRGDLEVEAGYARFEGGRYFDRSNHPEKRRVLLINEPEIKATYGLLENFDISLEHAWANILDAEEERCDVRGSGDSAAGFKWNFFSSEESGVLLSWYPKAVIPNGVKATSDRPGISQEYHSLDQLIILTLTRNMFTMNIDSGFMLPVGSDREDSRGDFVSDIAAGIQVSEWLQPEIELNYSHGYVSGGSDSDTVSVTAGLIMNVADQWRVDLGAYQVLYGRNSDSGTGLLVNFSHTFTLE